MRINRDVSPIHLAFDDTDSTDGMCTTYLATLMVEALSEFDLIGLPRLVRLNPNVPWKTRGNAAISMTFGVGKGRSFKVGELDGATILSYARGGEADPHEILCTAEKIVLRSAHLQCEKTNPGIVVSSERPSPRLYWRAVREIISLNEATREVKQANGRIKKFKNGRGVIGAAAAMAWRPQDFTFEVLAYRRPNKIGTKRNVDAESVRRMDETFRSTFHNIDLETGHLAISPGSPCPILFGIRGDDPADLVAAKDVIQCEPIDRWLLFLTNQGTDDHLMMRCVSDLRPRVGAKVRGTVKGRARTVAGGHVFFELRDNTDTITCAIYEPSGSMRSTARMLIDGDAIVVCGSARETPFELNVEKFELIAAAPHNEKVENPLCPSCGKHMKSAGRNAGYRCRGCGERALASAAKMGRRTPPKSGWYEPPVPSRRHLHKPASRFGIKRRSLREILYTYANVESSCPRDGGRMNNGVSK